MRSVRLSFYLAAVVSAVLLYAAPLGADSQPAAACRTCGSERWLVKVLAPPLDAQVVNASQPPTNTVAGLNALTRPARRPPDALAPPNEGHAVDVTGCMYYVKEQPDLDYHVAMADLKDPRKTLVAEIPNTSCAGACRSKFKPRYDTARTALLSLGPVRALLQQIAALQLNAKPNPQQSASAAFLKNPIVVQVRGVQFFDNRNHGIGGNNTGIEIHPVYELHGTNRGCSAPPANVIQQQLQR